MIKYFFQRKAIMFTIALWVVVNIAGCEAFVRKFTRKSKKENMSREEMVVAPQEYKAPVIPKEEQYRQYFLYWKSWHDELIDSLSYNSNPKKQLDCISEAIKNLQALKDMLKEEKQKILAGYISQLERLKNVISNDAYGIHSVSSRFDAERLRRDILQKFSYNRIKNFLA
jgi:hypothetical protein